MLDFRLSELGENAFLLPVGGILLLQPYCGTFTLAPAPIAIKLQSALPAKCRPFSHGCSQPQQEDSHTSKEEALLQLFPAGIRKE